MELKKYENSLSLTDYTEGLIQSRRGFKTLGEVWEHCIKCNYCEHQAACQALGAEYPEIMCSQVIDILLGDLKIENLKGGTK